jgi:hypothetical protein
MGDSFLDSIVTGDDTWIHHCKPKSKQQSVEWQHKHKVTKKKFKVQPSAGKIMHCHLVQERDYPCDILK